MKPRNTIILILLATGAYFFLRYYETNQPTTQETEENAGRVIQFDSGNIDGITITNNDTRIELRKRDSHWMMDEPVKDRADAAAITTLMNTFEILDKDTSIKLDGGKTDARELGFVKPSVTLQLLGQNAPPEVLFGKDTAIEGKQYIRLANSDEVLVVPTDLKALVTKPVDSFRDHQLSDVAASQIIKVNLKTAAGEIELDKDHDHWQIARPIKARGDDARISDLVAQTLNTKVDSFVSTDNAAAANTALNDAAGSVTFTAEGVDQPYVLQLSKPIDKMPGKVYAKLSSRDAALVLSASTAAVLGAKPNGLRDRHLMRLNLDTVDRIHITAAGKPDILLARNGENWTVKSIGDKPANSGAVMAMAQALQNQPVTEFISDVATDLPKYGLDTPGLKVTFSSFASDNTAETKAGEEPLETVEFGVFQGQKLVAKLNDEPFIVAVPKAILDLIYTDPLMWQDLAIFNTKPDDIVAMDVTKDGQATLSLTKDKGAWKPAKGDIALNTANIASIASTLSTLRAEQWAGQTAPEQGLDKPAVTIAFTTADKQTHTVKLGAAAGDYWNASAAGLEGTFLISKTDHDTLTADILPGASAPTPVATGTDGASPAPEK